MLRVFGILLVVMALFTFKAQASFFECTLPQAEEYRVGIDIEKKMAGFFDNDTTSIMKLSSSRPSKKDPEIRVLVFTGKDLGGSGDLKLEFNFSTKRIKLSTVETDGTVELLGYADCLDNREAWNFEELQ
jgi:hypothetical protein